MMSIAETEGTYFVLGTELLRSDLHLGWRTHVSIVVWLSVHIWSFGTF